MNDDLVERAASLARERYDGASASAAKTEDLVLAALRARSLRRNRSPVLGILLLAALLACAAWAAASEATRARLKAAVSELVSRHSAPRERELVHEASSPPALSITTAAPDDPLRRESSQPLQPPEPLGTLHRSLGRPPPRGSAAAVGAAPSSAASSAPTTDIDALYRAAHRAQFAGQDPALALALWDRYLAAAPNGSLSPEARYNRAITLARLGRNAEAASALEPFARGDYGPYRQADASSLLEALRGTSAPLAH